MTRTCEAIRSAYEPRKLLIIQSVFVILIVVIFALSLSRVTSANETADAKAVEKLYEGFVAAQNARDIDAVRTLLSSSTDFQWVSDGKVFWGRETMLQRMAMFQKSQVWRVEPDKSGRRYISLGPDAGFLFQPLTLVIGSDVAPDRLQFLVNIMCKKDASGWRIAALFTTSLKP